MIATSMAAAGYETLPLNKNFEDAKTLSRVQRAASDFGRGREANPRMVDAFYRLYLPAVVTDPNRSVAAAEAMELVQENVKRAGNSRQADVIQKVNQATFEGLGRIASGNYLPSARAAALAVLGGLEAAPADPRANRPPQMFGPALGVMYRVLADESASMGVRAAALSGVHRHVIYTPQMPDRVAAAIRTEAQKWLDRPADPTSDPDAHAYVQRYAVDIIDRLTDLKDPAFGTQLISVSTNEETPHLLALHSASRVAERGASMKGQIDDITAVTNAWAGRLLDTLAGEVARLKAEPTPTRAAKQPDDPRSFLQRAEGPVANNRISTTGRGGGGRQEDFASQAAQMGAQMGAMMGGGRRDAGGMGMTGPPMGMMGMMGMGGAMPIQEQPLSVKTARRMINETIELLMRGTTGTPETEIPSEAAGLLAATEDDARKEVEGFVMLVKEISDKLNDSKLDTEVTFNEELQNQVDQLRSRLGVTASAEQVEAEAAPLPMEVLLRGGGRAAAPAAPAMPGQAGMPQPAAGQPAGGLPAADNSLEALTELE